MSLLKQILIRFAPQFILELAKSWKKNIRRREINTQRKTNAALTKEFLIEELKRIGIKSGDHVLVHSALSKIGYIENGPTTLINALLDVVGADGTLLMPSFPAKGRNKDHLESHPFFDMKNTPSQMGITTEIFRKMPNIFRSFHPTDAVCAKGKLAEHFTNSHYNQLTPYNEFSPFRKLCDANGKILMLGTTLNGACTNLHTLEDAVNFEYPVYDNRIFEVNMIDAYNNKSTVKTKVHNPTYSAKRNADALKPLFEKEKVLTNDQIGDAKTMLIDAKKMLEVMIEYYNGDGVTMYTPYGKKGNLKYSS